MGCGCHVVVQVQDRFGNRPADDAARHSHAGVVQLLCASRGADTDTDTRWGLGHAASSSDMAQPELEAVPAAEARQAGAPHGATVRTKWMAQRETVAASGFQGDGDPDDGAGAGASANADADWSTSVNPLSNGQDGQDSVFAQEQESDV